ncbi:snRNA-activating protein complex subunit [Acorus calamus]|uniref:snRNA-activating protein complex subunit n=1 Tax=Acorus calamus TaxID=4465 RepID=A0AAV9E8Z1_ACOCL|nr:snRNA-activating protein complex subunit [Acorus calamus]
MIDDPGISNGISCSQHPTAESNDTCSPAENSSNSMCIVNHSDKKIHRDTKKRKKRGRVFDRELRATELESNYIEKVEELAKIKQKQDEDKAAARLHSFNGSAKFVESAPKLEKMDRKKALRSVTAPMKVKPSSAVEHVPVCYPEIVLCVEIYHPRKDHKTQEFLVLGSQKLTELRDNIYCVTDQLMQTAGEYEPSGYFLIEDLFCNDLRDPSAIDYSRPIFDWLKNSKGEALEKWKHIMTGEYNWKEKSLVGDLPVAQLPDFKTTDMHKTRFCDLQFRLGSGYLYCHQGDCKHMVVIRDMRLINPDDVQNRNAYPIRMFQIRNRLHKCSVCGIYRATKVTVDDKWAQKNPCYFCENCYFLLHYKEDRSLLYDEFASYDYYQE